MGKSCNMQNDVFIEIYKDLLASLSPHSYKTIRPELLNKILRNIEKPEEKVRYFWVLKIVNEYGYDERKIDINIPAGVGRNRHNVYADIVVYRDLKRTESFIVGEVKKEGDWDNSDGEQGASYARNIGADYHFWSNKLETRYWITAKFPNKSESIGNMPRWVSNKPIAQKISKKEHLPSFKDENELREVIGLCHDLILEKQGHDPAKAFDELTKLLFIKLYDEREVPNYYEFVVLFGEKPVDVSLRIKELFHDGIISSRYRDVFYSKFRKEIDASLDLDDFTIYKIVQLLQGYSLVNTTENIKGADIKGTVFEQMVGNTFRGELAQFFTPRNIVEFMVKLLNPSKNDRILDPACGSGGFLIMTLRHIKERLKIEIPNLSLSEQTYQIRSFAEHNAFGIDINDRVTRVAKMNMIMHGDGHGGIYHTNGLLTDKETPLEVLEKFKDNSFNIVFSNPPFAGREKDEEVLKRFDLGKNIKGKIRSVSKEVLFIEKIIKFLDFGGKAGLVLPAGCFNNITMKQLRDYIRKHVKILALIGLPHLSFQVTGANNEGSLLFIEKVREVPEDYKIFIDWAGEVGFDATGKTIAQNDLPDILEKYKNPKEENLIMFSQLEERIDPWYYHPKYKMIEKNLKKTAYQLMPLSDLFTFSKHYVDKKANTEEIVTYIETNDVNLITGEIFPNIQITKKDLPNRAKYILRENDILIPNARDCVRGVAMASKQHEGYVVTNRFFVVRHNEDLVDLKYLYYLLNLPEIHYLLKKQATGEINPSIPADNLALIQVPVPEKKEQQLKIVESIKKNEKYIQGLLENIENYKLSILKEIRGNIPSLGQPCERARKLGSEFINFI